MKRLAVLLALAACGAPAELAVRTNIQPAPGRTHLAPEFETPTTSTIPARPVTSPRASRRRPAARVSPLPRAPQVTQVAGDIFDALARCESGGNPRAVGGGGRYFGAFQFSLGTWHSLGMSGNPVDHDYATQKAAAQRLVARSGWGQFPVCSRQIGAR